MAKSKVFALHLGLSITYILIKTKNLSESWEKINRIMSEKEAWNWKFSRGLPIRMTHKRCLPWKVHSKTWTVVFRIMKLEIFKEITHSYDPQEMFAMKSSLKNLTYGFPNLTAKNILENWPMILHNTRLIPLDSQTTLPLDFYHDFRSSCWNLQTLQPQPITGGKGGGGVWVSLSLNHSSKCFQHYSWRFFLLKIFLK